MSEHPLGDFRGLRNPCVVRLRVFVFRSLSDMDTKEESVLFCEVSSVQGLKSMQEWYLGREKVSCLERCPHFSNVLIEVV